MHEGPACPLFWRSAQARAWPVCAQVRCRVMWQLPQVVCCVAGFEYPTKAASSVGELGVLLLSLVHDASARAAIAPRLRSENWTERWFIRRLPGFQAMAPAWCWNQHG